MRLSGCRWRGLPVQSGDVRRVHLLHVWRSLPEWTVWVPKRVHDAGQWNVRAQLYRDQRLCLRESVLWNGPSQWLLQWRDMHRPRKQHGYLLERHRLSNWVVLQRRRAL
jgi:hypothetical protein